MLSEHLVSNGLVEEVAGELCEAIAEHKRAGEAL